MVSYGFIDESGTMDDQEIMTVGLIILNGQFVARNLQQLILKHLYPKRFARRKNKRHGNQPAMTLHYFELELAQRAEVARVLACQNISLHCCYYYHDGEPKSHEIRTEIYARMVKTCILSALEHHRELSICVASQGTGSHQKSEFLTALKLIPCSYQHYRKVKFSLGTNLDEGVQLADFYVGAARDYFRSALLQDNSLATAFEIIAAQVAGELILEPGRGACF